MDTLINIIDKTLFIYMKLNVQGTLHDLPAASVCNQCTAHILTKLWSDNRYTVMFVLYYQFTN